MSGIVSREEIRRLEKAARDKNKGKLAQWLEEFEYYVESILRQEYNKEYEEELQNAIENLIVAVTYTAYYSEENKVDKGNLSGYMTDLFVTIDMFRTGEYTPEEYKADLEKEGIILDEYDYTKIYKDFLKTIDTDLVNYLKFPHEKIVTICVDNNYLDKAKELYDQLTIDNYITMTIKSTKEDNLFKEEKAQLEKQYKHKILISDILYIEDIEENKTYIDYAKEHNKEIKYIKWSEESAK